MADHAVKAALYDALAESAKALANGRRAELVDVLAQGERSVEELALEIDQTVANTSQHLQRLLRAGASSVLAATERGSTTPSRARAWGRCGGPCGGWPRPGL